MSTIILLIINLKLPFIEIVMDLYYSINKPMPESLVVLKILDSIKDGREGRPKMMKKEPNTAS